MLFCFIIMKSLPCHIYPCPQVMPVNSFNLETCSTTVQGSTFEARSDVADPTSRPLGLTRLGRDGTDGARCPRGIGSMSP